MWDPYEDANPSDMSDEDADAYGDASCIQLRHLTSLVDLRLSFVALSAAELAGATQITRLMLQGCALLPRAQPNATAPAGISALLSTVAGFEQLQHLELLDLDLRGHEALPLQRFAALTASPELTYLEVSGEEGFRPLPDGAVQHMFPTDRTLKLRQLLLLPSKGTRGQEWPLDDMSCCVTGAELHGIASSCPELQQLCIAGAVHPGDMSGLMQLPASCTELSLGGPAMSDAVLPVVRQLTQLRDLSWYYSAGLTDVGVEQLTALTRLCGLDVRHCSGLSDELGGTPQYGSDLQVYSGDDDEVGGKISASVVGCQSQPASC